MSTNPLSGDSLRFASVCVAERHRTDKLDINGIPSPECKCLSDMPWSWRAVGSPPPLVMLRNPDSNVHAESDGTLRSY